MIYYTETMVETSSTSHFRTFLKPTSKYYTAKGAKGPRRFARARWRAVTPLEVAAAA